VPASAAARSGGLTALRSPWTSPCHCRLGMRAGGSGGPFAPWAEQAGGHGSAATWPVDGCVRGGCQRGGDCAGRTLLARVSTSARTLRRETLRPAQDFAWARGPLRGGPRPTAVPGRTSSSLIGTLSGSSELTDLLDGNTGGPLRRREHNAAFGCNQTRRKRRARHAAFRVRRSVTDRGARRGNVASRVRCKPNRCLGWVCLARRFLRENPGRAH